VHVRLAPPLPPGREELVTLRVAEGESVEAETTRLLRELLDEGALVAEVRRGSSLERSFLEGR
jgi:hypothetical protein